MRGMFLVLFSAVGLAVTSLSIVECLPLCALVMQLRTWIVCLGELVCSGYDALTEAGGAGERAGEKAVGAGGFQPDGAPHIRVGQVCTREVRAG